MPPAASNAIPALMDAREAPARGIPTLACAVWFLAAAVVVFAVVAAGWLPETYPSHFDISGKPDRWSHGPPGAAWYVVAGVGAAISVGVSALGLGLRRIPADVLNMPRKEQFLKLDAAAREPVYRALTGMLLQLAFVVGLTFLGIQIAMLGSAHRGSMGPYLAFPVGGLALVIVVLVANVVHVTRVVRRATGG